MQNKYRLLTFAIHDLNPWGGHDRSTLEIARRLSCKFPTQIYSYTLEDPLGKSAWGQYDYIRVWPELRKPAIFLTGYFYLNSIWRFNLLPKIKNIQRPVIHATGACSFVSDIIQVQFINSAWKKIKSNALGPSERSSINNIYHNIILNYDIWIEHQVFKKQKSYIAISNQVANELNAEFGIRDHVHVIHHGVDSRTFCPVMENVMEREQLRKNLGISCDEVLIVFVGAYARKGLLQAIQTFAALAPHIKKKTKLLAIGRGDLDFFKQQAKAFNIEKHLLLMNSIKDIAPYYRASDLFLLPTLYEPFGLVILEAMSCGLPVLVSKRAGASELICDGKSGVLIDDPLDVNKLAHQLELMIENPEMRKKLGEQARLVAEKRSWDQVAQEYATVLEPLLLK
ncbi:MAG: glycosyltransferase family 4 protein [Bdellovibrio sp.]|nr:glycosyltransferase family 4 protein [Bdellovibrio sp.]